MAIGQIQPHIYHMQHPEHSRLDQLDLQILSKLVENGNLAYTDLAKQLFVSSGTIHVRMKKMEEMGIVRGSSLLLDYHKLGYDVTAYVGLYLEKSSLFDSVAHALAEVPEVVEASCTTGAYTLFCKIMCRDTAHLRQVLQDKIQKIAGVQRAETFVSLEQRILRAPSFIDN